MPRYVSDEYELPDDDELPIEGKLYHRRRRFPAWAFFALFGVIAVVAGVASFFYFSDRQEQDSFCLGCHTPQHADYVRRAETSVAGALAPDLSSFHYQQIRGQSGDIRCIDCHRGDNSFEHRVQTMLLSARMAGRWLAGTDNRRLEKTTLTTGVRNGITVTLPQTSFALSEPRLSNAGCIGCHENALLVAGTDNHMHNMLPAVYDTWKRGARLIAPKDATDPQVVMAQGLTRFDTQVQCSNCHQAHRTTEAEGYLDRQVVVKAACEQCHRETGRGPAEVEVPAPQ